MLDQKSIQEMPLSAEIDTRPNGFIPFTNTVVPKLSAVVGSILVASTAFAAVMSAVREQSVQEKK